MFFHSALSLFILIPFSVIGFAIASQAEKSLSKFFLLAFSLFFYGFDQPLFLIPLLWSAITDYFITDLLITKKNLNFAHKRILLLTSIVSNISLLFAFKYIPLVAESLDLLGIAASIPSSLLNIVMPAGISFYTFQTLSFVFDAYRGRVKSKINLIDYLVYVCYFPQLVAGPILRPNQFFDDNGNMLLSTKNSRIYSGFQRICFGIFLKLVLADELARLNSLSQFIHL